MCGLLGVPALVGYVLDSDCIDLVQRGVAGVVSVECRDMLAESFPRHSSILLPREGPLALRPADQLLTVVHPG